MSETPIVSDEFIEENQQLCQTMPKKGGRYSKKELLFRRNEVFRLHFDYGYSARKIADIMKINRNTITNDVQYWYSQVSKKWKKVDPTKWTIRSTERLESQRTRLREELDRTKNIQDRLSIERLILEVESKILQTPIKILGTIANNHELATKQVNDWLKKNKHEDRFLAYNDLIRVSSKSKEKINKIINDEKTSGEGVY